MKCTNCGKEMDSSTKLCDYCGVQLIHLNRSAHTSIQRVGPPGYLCFILLDKWDVATLYEQPSDKSRILCKLGKGEPVLIISEQKEWFEVLLSGELTGFVYKEAGRKLEIATEKVTNPLGYYRVNTDATTGQGRGSQKVKEVNVRVLPDYSATPIIALQPWQCVPIIEDRKGWFKVQLDDGVRGFAPEEYGIRTLQKESLPLPKSPSDKSGTSVLGGIATFVGLMALGTITSGIKQGLKDLE